MNGDRFDINGHYIVTLIDAYTAHYRISSAVRMPEQLASALARPYSGYLTEIYQKAAVLMDSLAGSQVFFTANKRTAIALVNLLIVKSGYVLHLPPESKKKITNKVEQLSKAVGARKMPLDRLTAWYEIHIARSS